MKILFLECNMGAAGDMLMAALLELIPNKQAFIKKMNALGLPGVQVEAEKAVKCGVIGTHMKVMVNGEEESFDEPEHHTHHEHQHGHPHEHKDENGHHHHHASMSDIGKIIDNLNISDKVKGDAKAVYTLIAEAESQVHGQSVSEIHFHEVGTMDAVADVVGVCLLMEMIGAEKVVASPVHVGSGYAWHTACSRPCHCTDPQGHSNLWRTGAWRTLHAYRRGTA